MADPSGPCLAVVDDSHALLLQDLLCRRPVSGRRALQDLWPCTSHPISATAILLAPSATPSRSPFPVPCMSLPLHNSASCRAYFLLPSKARPHPPSFSSLGFCSGTTCRSKLDRASPVEMRLTRVLLPNLSATVVASSTPAGPLPTTTTVLLTASSSICMALCTCNTRSTAKRKQTECTVDSTLGLTGMSFKDRTLSASHTNLAAGNRTSPPPLPRKPLCVYHMTCMDQSDAVLQ